MYALGSTACVIYRWFEITNTHALRLTSLTGKKVQLCPLQSVTVGGIWK